MNQKPQTFPKISVLIPTCNRASLLVEAIESALAQDYPNFEVIVLDNNTSDESSWRPVASHCQALGPRNLTERWPETRIVHGTSRQDEAQHTLARRFQTTLADAFTEQLVPVLKDCEVTDEALRAHDLALLGGPRDNSLVARLWQALGDSAPATLGDGFFRFRGTTDADPAHGLFLAFPSPLAPDRLVWLFAGNSALALYAMTKNNVGGLPSWAFFHGDEAKEQGYLPVARFVFAGPGG